MIQCTYKRHLLSLEHVQKTSFEHLQDIDLLLVKIILLLNLQVICDHAFRYYFLLSLYNHSFVLANAPRFLWNGKASWKKLLRYYVRKLRSIFLCISFFFIFTYPRGVEERGKTESMWSANIIALILI